MKTLQRQEQKSKKIAAHLHENQTNQQKFKERYEHRTEINTLKGLALSIRLKGMPILKRFSTMLKFTWSSLILKTVPSLWKHSAYVHFPEIHIQQFMIRNATVKSSEKLHGELLKRFDTP